MEHVGAVGILVQSFAFYRVEKCGSPEDTANSENQKIGRSLNECGRFLFSGGRHAFSGHRLTFFSVFWRVLFVRIGAHLVGVFCVSRLVLLNSRRGFCSVVRSWGCIAVAAGQVWTLQVRAVALQ